MSSVDPFLARTHIAYFSMEMAVRAEMHTYAGGLGVLAGDTARSCADLELPVVFVTLLSRAGYFRQEIAADRAAGLVGARALVRAAQCDGRRRNRAEAGVDPPLPLHSHLSTRPPDPDPAARHPARSKQRRRSHADALSLWRRRGLPAQAGDRPWHRRHSNFACARLRSPYPSLERGSCRAVDPRSVEPLAHPARRPRSWRTGLRCGRGTGPLCVHDAHTRRSRPRPLLL